MKTTKRLFFLFAVFLFSIFILLPAGVFAGEGFKVDINGYISQGFLVSNGNNYLADTEEGSFQFNELGINFSTELTDKLRVGIQLAARDLGDLGNDKIIVDWAYADYRWRDWLGIRVGIIKIPIGLYNKTRDLDMLRTSVLLPQSIYSETFRDSLTSVKGFGGYGNVPLKGLGDFSYQVLFGTMNIDKEGGTSKAAEAGGDLKVKKYEVNKVYCWAVDWETPLEGLRIGASQVYTDLEAISVLTKDITVPVSFPPYTLTIAERGTNTVFHIPRFLQTVYSVEYTWRDLVLAAEYGREDQDVVNRIPGMEPMEWKRQFEMVYAGATYRFSNWFETGIYYSAIYVDRNDRDGTKTPYAPTFSAFQKDACLSFRFDLNDRWIFKLEGHLMDGVALCFPQDNLNNDGVPGYDRKWFLLAAKMTFSF